MRYAITYLDMYDYGDSWNGPEFTRADDALAHAKAVLDNFLQGEFVSGMTGKELYDRFMMFGEAVVIASLDGTPSLNFSGQEYVRQRSEELCAIAKPDRSDVIAESTKPAAEGVPPANCLTSPSDDGLMRSRMLSAGATFAQMELWPAAPRHYPPGTTFFEVHGVAVLRSPLGFCWAADASFCSMDMINQFGSPLSEVEFEALAGKAFRSPP